MNIKKNQGFTLIELLVVIAIIGILSSVVLASLNTARDKGRDGALKSSMQTVRVQAELYYDGVGGNAFETPGGVGNDTCTGDMWSDTTIAAAVTEVTSIAANGDVDCRASDQQWAMSAALNDPVGAGTHWCVDYRGVASTTGAALAAATYNCD